MIFIVLIFSSKYTYYFSDVQNFFFTKLFINFLHIVKQMTEAAIPSDVYFPYISYLNTLMIIFYGCVINAAKLEDAEMKTFMLIAVSVNICEGYIKMAARDCTA